MSILGEINLLAEKMAEKVDAKSRRTAKKLHNLGVIYVLYGALDGLSLSYSMIKYSFDLHLADSNLSSSDEMHDWLVSPAGAVVAAATSIFLIGFSLLANHFDDGDKDLVKRYIALLWPYLRDMMKGLKNAYKGIKSTLHVSELLGAGSLNYLILPIGLSLGLLSALNRIWFRWMVSKRKEMMKANANLLAYFQNSKKLTLENIDKKLEELQSQSTAIRVLAYLSAGYGGVVDGLYLYIGVLALSSLSPPTLIAMTVFCTIYFLACIATRMYEEYDFQQKLLISQAKIELAYEGKKLELLFNQLQELSASLADDPENKKLIEEQDLAIYLFEDAVADFKKRHDKLRSLTSSSYITAFLWGAKNGLAAYGALAAVLFVIGMAVSSFPPALLITIVVLGMGLFLGFIAHALINNYMQEAKQDEKKQEENTKPAMELKLADLGKLFKNARQEVKELKPEVIKSIILDGMAVDSSPQFFFQEWFEVIRSFFSGMSKGVKAIDLTMNPLETPGADGHFHESSIMIGFMVISSCLHALILALRALSRGFGRPAIDSIASSCDEEIELQTFNTKGQGYENSDEEEFQSIDNSTQSESCLSSMFSFFSEKQRDKVSKNPVKLRPSAYPTMFNPLIHNSSYIAEDSESDHYTF